MSTAYLAAAAIALGHAIQIKSGLYAPAALPWLTLALACSALGAAGPRSTRDWSTIVTVLLVAGVVWQISELAQAPPARYLQTKRLRPFHVWAAAEALVVLAGLLPVRKLKAAWFPILIAMQAGLGLWILRWSPAPQIDVVTVTNAALDALAHGHSPYAITFANIYGGDTSFYGQGAVADGRVLFGYPYPPVSLLLSLPGYALGDYRYASLAALLLTAVLIGYASPSPRARLAGALFLTTPRIFFVLEQGWSEPMSLLLLAQTVFVMLKVPAAAAPLSGITIASKQYLVVALVPLWRYARAWAPSVPAFAGLVIAAAAAMTLPFLLWSPRAFVDAVILLQAREPFRADSLSYLPWLSAHGWPEPSFLWTLIAMLSALAIVAWRGGASPASFPASLAFTTCATFAFGRKAFCNYYFFVIGALCCAIAAAVDTAANADMMANKRRTAHEPFVRSRP